MIFYTVSLKVADEKDWQNRMEDGSIAISPTCRNVVGEYATLTYDLYDQDMEEDMEELAGNSEDILNSYGGGA